MFLCRKISLALANLQLHVLRGRKKDVYAISQAKEKEIRKKISRFKMNVITCNSVLCRPLSPICQRYRFVLVVTSQTSVLFPKVHAKEKCTREAVKSFPFQGGRFSKGLQLHRRSNTVEEGLVEQRK